MESKSRFRVQMVNTNETDTNNVEEESEKQETICGRNNKYFTREALPRLDNYRHIMSIQAAYRPTLEDLHNPVTATKVSPLSYFFNKFEILNLIFTKHYPLF